MGCICIMFSAFFYALQGVLSKLCTDRGMPVVAVVMGSCATQVVLSFLVTKRYVGMPEDCGGWHVLSVVFQGIFNVTAILLWFSSYTKLDVGDASALAYAYPLYLPFLCAVFLREVTPWYTWVATLTSLSGMVLIARPAAIFGSADQGDASPTGGLDHFEGTVLAASSAISFAFYIIAARALGESVHAIVSCGGMSFVGLTLVCPAAWLVQGATGALLPATPNEWLATVPVGAAGFMATGLATAGYQRAPAAQAAVLSLLDVVFSFIAQPLVFSQALDPMSVTGAGIILSGCLGQSLMAARNEESEATGAMESVPSMSRAGLSADSTFIRRDSSSSSLKKAGEEGLKESLL